MAACSDEYLVTLTVDILRARAFPLVKLVREHDVEAQIRRLQFVCGEVRRLFRSPALFPSPASRVRFAALIGSDANLQFAQAVKKLLLQQVTGQLHQFSRAQYTRTSYQEGTKGWENFFSNKAPGAPKRGQLPKTAQLSTYQVVPIAGMRIVGDLSRAEQSLSDWIEELHLMHEVEPASTTQLLDLDNESETEPKPAHELCQKAENITVRPNPFSEHLKLQLDLPRFGPEPLEEYTPFIGRLEEAAPPPDMPVAALNAPNIFPMLSVQTWHADSKETWSRVQD